jgi:hypothetical protein
MVLDDHESEPEKDPESDEGKRLLSMSLNLFSFRTTRLPASQEGTQRPSPSCRCCSVFRRRSQKAWSTGQGCCGCSSTSQQQQRRKGISGQW